MAKYTDESNITFNNAVAGDPMPKITNGMNDYTDLDAGVNPLVNAIEIDWNEAQLGTYIVKTTGELWGLALFSFSSPKTARPTIILTIFSFVGLISELI